MLAEKVAKSATVVSNNLAFIIVRPNCLAAAGAIPEKEPRLMRPKITLLGLHTNALQAMLHRRPNGGRPVGTHRADFQMRNPVLSRRRVTESTDGPRRDNRPAQRCCRALTVQPEQQEVGDRGAVRLRTRSLFILTNNSSNLVTFYSLLLLQHLCNLSDCPNVFRHYFRSCFRCCHNEFISLF